MKPTIAISNEYVESWKKEGKKVVGTVCCHIPEEVIHAAGMLRSVSAARNVQMTVTVRPG